MEIETATFGINNVICKGVRIELHNAPMIAVFAPKGFIMCGYLNLLAADRAGEAACVVTGVKSFEDIMKGKIRATTKAARALGIKSGMTGREALALMG